MTLQKVQLDDFVSLTKKEIGELGQKNIDSWCDNGDDILAMLSLITKITEYATEVKRKLAKRSYDEVALYGKEGVTKNGVALSLFSSSQYDYSNSEAWNNLEEQIKALKASQKDIETIAKALNQKTSWVDADAVEWDIYPAIRTGIETVKALIK
jgi:hypothetical protein